jgi:hypothetical protein
MITSRNITSYIGVKYTQFVLFGEHKLNHFLANNQNIAYILIVDKILTLAIPGFERT